MALQPRSTPKPSATDAGIFLWMTWQAMSQAGLARRLLPKAYARLYANSRTDAERRHHCEVLPVAGVE